MVMWRALVQRELQLLGRQKADWLNPIGVFFIGPELVSAWDRS